MARVSVGDADGVADAGAEGVAVVVAEPVAAAVVVAAPEVDPPGRAGSQCCGRGAGAEKHAQRPAAHQRREVEFQAAVMVGMRFVGRLR